MKEIEYGKKYQIGDVTLESISEVDPDGDLDVWYSPEFIRPGLVQTLQENREHLQWVESISAAKDDFNCITGGGQPFLLKAHGKNIIIDTGSNAPGNTFEKKLKAAGCTPENIDYVLFDHLHYDHTGKNCILGMYGELEPYFPNARYLFNKDQYDHLQELQDDPSKRRGYNEYDHLWCFRTQMLPLVEKGKVDFIDTDFTLLDVITIVPLPGHMYGHTGVMIKSAGDSLLIGGDLFLNEFQYTLIEDVSTWEYDAETTIKTRKALFEELSKTDTLFWHDHGLAPGYIRKHTKGYKLVPVS
jgi:glyoxylase-like metal-dependent hydrolase (beta-lactamase superfamily II)